MDKIETLLRKVDAINRKLETALLPKPIWLTSKDFSRLAGGLTAEQLRTIRANYPDYIKPKTKEGKDEQSYYYDWNFLQHLYPSQSKAA